MDMQLYTQAIKDSFRSKPNNRKLLKYGKVFGIEEKIRIYMECYNENPGTVIGSMNGISERTTMDMDTTVRGIQMEEDEILLR